VIAYDKDGGAAGSLTNVYLLHATRLARYSAGEAERLTAILDTANRNIKALINRAKSIDTKKQYARVAAEIRAITKQLNEQLYGQLHLDFEELAAEEMAFVEKSLRDIGVTADLGLTHISPQKIWAAASFASYAADGHETFETYLNGLSDNLYKTWDTAVRAGYLTGMTAREINRQVLGSVKDMEPGQMQGLRNSLNANTITMISSMAETARDAVYKENESLFDGYKYLATLDTRTCLVCAADDGKIFKSLDEAPKLPSHHNCILGDTDISTIKGISNIFRRIYEGEIIVITTASGNVLRCTPNHPILCDFGFVPAKHVENGYKLVVNNGLKIISIGNKNNDNKVTRIEDVFSSFSKSIRMSAVTMPLSSEDFHGDVTDKKVNIIRPTGVFSLKGNHVFSKIFGKNRLISRTSENLIFIPCNGHFGSFFKSLYSAIKCFAGSFGHFFSLFISRKFHSFYLLFLAVTGLDPISIKKADHIHSAITEPSGNAFNPNAMSIKIKNFLNIGRLNVLSRGGVNTSLMQNFSDGLMIDPDLSRNIFNRYKRLIKTDNVVSVKRHWFSGHVYNLETNNNWYLANNIIIHNCRCLYVPYLKGFEDIPGERAAMNGPVSDKMTYADWLAQQNGAVQREILGPARYKMYQEGMKITSFVPDGRLLTLKELTGE
jgi:hypothetical protein